jgi:hypothetical protein
MVVEKIKHGEEDHAYFYMHYDNNIVLLGLIKVTIEHMYICVFSVNNRKTSEYSC